MQVAWADPRIEPRMEASAPLDSGLAIEVEDLAKTYSSGDVQVHALRGVSLSVRRGEMVAIMGPSGCGKTSLLYCISGLDGLDSGTVRIGGVNLASLNDMQKTSSARTTWASSSRPTTSCPSSRPSRT